jgi:hypothetical protein
MALDSMGTRLHAVWRDLLDDDDVAALAGIVMSAACGTLLSQWISNGTPPPLAVRRLDPAPTD